MEKAQCCCWANFIFCFEILPVFHYHHRLFYNLLAFSFRCCDSGEIEEDNERNYELWGTNTLKPYPTDLTNNNFQLYFHISTAEFKDTRKMIINGCTSPSGYGIMNFRASQFTHRRLVSARIPSSVSPLSIRSSWQEPKSCLSIPSCGSFHNLSAVCGERSGFPHMIPYLPRKRGSYLPARASKDVPSSFRFPPMTKKPRWWWRTLACLPYLMPFHETWMYAQTAYNLHPFLEQFEYFTYPFLRAIGSLPGWFLMAYFFCAYLGVVRRKEWPHFFRFHVVTGMLLEIALQVVGTVSRWMPQGLYWGKIGMHFWTALAFAHLFTVMECIRCALCGMYADVPFVCDAAYIQIPYD